MKTVRILLWSVLGFSLLLLIVAGVLLYRPEFIVESKSFQSWIKNTVRETGIEWAEADIKFQSHSLFKKEINFQGTDVCLQQKKEIAAVCFQEVDMRATLTATLSGQIKLHVSPLILKKGEVPLPTQRKKLLLSTLEKVPPDGVACQADVMLNYRLQFQTSKLHCPLSLTYPFHLPPIPVPASWKMQIAAEFSLDATESRQAHLKGNIHIEPEKFKLLSMTTQMSFESVGKLADSFDNWLTTLNGETLLNLSQFEKLVTQLQRSRWAVPAPFHQLKGPLKLDVKFQSTDLKKYLDADVELKTELASAKQKLHASGKSKVSLRDLWESLRGEVISDVLFEEVTLQLPFLHLPHLPTLSLDKRISPVSSKKNKKTNSPIRFQTNLRTKKEIHFLSNLAQSPIPVSFQLKSSFTGLSGSFNIGAFNTELFRRRARVLFLKLNADAVDESFTLKGHVVYNASETEIRILLAGTTEQPVILLESDPPLTEEQIVSILVFGRPLESLTDDEAISAHNIDTAVTTVAFSLASLYFLATTPIEYVGYNLESKTYSTRFRLGQTASLEFGTDLEKSDYLSFRKRLGKHFAIETEYKKFRTGESNVLTTFLQWFTRY